MQKMIVESSIYVLRAEVNQQLERGWKVVPGTMGAYSHPLAHEAGGFVSYEKMFWVVLEKPKQPDPIDNIWP